MQKDIMYETLTEISKIKQFEQQNFFTLKNSTILSVSEHFAKKFDFDFETNYLMDIEPSQVHQ